MDVQTARNASSYFLGGGNWSIVEGSHELARSRQISRSAGRSRAAELSRRDDAPSRAHRAATIPARTVTMVKLLRRRLRCHGCGETSPSERSGVARAWVCPYCEAVNHVDEVTQARAINTMYICESLSDLLCSVARSPTRPSS